MTPSGLIHHLLKEVRKYARLGIRAFLRYLCGYPADVSRWSTVEMAFSKRIGQRVRWACQWRATRPELGEMRCNYLEGYDLQRAIVARIGDTVPNSSLPRELRVGTLGKPNLVYKLEAFHKKEVPISNWEILRQGVVPDKYRSYDFLEKPGYITLYYWNRKIQIKEEDLFLGNPQMIVTKSHISPHKWIEGRITYPFLDDTSSGPETYASDDGEYPSDTDVSTEDSDIW